MRPRLMLAIGLVLALGSANVSAALAAASTGADLQISGSASTGSPNAGSNFSYTFGVKNAGPEAAATTFVDRLPDGVGFASATIAGAAGCAFAAPTVTCDLGTVASGGGVTVVINAYAPSVVGTNADTASVSSGLTDPNTANNSVTVTVGVKTPAIDTIKVSKCYTNATATSGGEMLIKASSSDPTARLFAYRPDGTLIGEVQNGGGSRYGGTVMPWQPYDPVNVIIRSSSGGSITTPTGPFQI